MIILKLHTGSSSLESFVGLAFCARASRALQLGQIGRAGHHRREYRNRLAKAIEAEAVDQRVSAGHGFRQPSPWAGATGGTVTVEVVTPPES